MHRIVTSGIALLTLLSSAACATADPQPPLAARVLGAEIRTTDAEEVRYEVLRRLTDRYAERHAIAVSPEELSAYEESRQAGLAEERAKMQTRRSELEARRAAPGLSATDRALLAEQIAETDEVIASLAADETPSAEDRAARAEIATAFVRQWKIHQALWRQYGGRIGYQQGGPEPLDAVRKFLEERKAAGDFEIVDPKLESAFWRYYRDDGIHDFMPAGSADEARAFTTPPWAPAPFALAGTRWRLLEIQSMDDAIGTTKPADPSRYTLAFGADGQVALGLDCNRGTGTFEATPSSDAGSGTLRFGPVAATRALCPPPSLGERIARDMDFVRSYLWRNGQLALSLEADAAIYLWEPDPAAGK